MIKSLPVFDCLSCGACCLHAGGVVLLAEDAARLASSLGLPEEEVRIRFTSDGEHLRTQGRDVPACVFLDGKRCTVYEARPQVCRDYLVGGGACLRERRKMGLPTDAPPPSSPGSSPSEDHRPAGAGD